MSTINAALRLSLDVLESFSASELPTAASPSVKHNQANLAQTLNASSTPAGTKLYAKKLTGTQTLDLTALTDTLGAALDCTGLKLQAILLENLSTTNTVVISDPANPYSLNATAAITVPAGATLGMYFNDKLADVAAGAKGITFTATAGQTYNLLMVFG